MKKQTIIAFGPEVVEFPQGKPASSIRAKCNENLLGSTASLLQTILENGIESLARLTKFP